MSAEDVVRRFLAEQAPTVTYTGIFLDDASHRKLIAWWNKINAIPLHADVYAHHMTIKFQPTAEQVQALPLGRKTTVKVVGWAADERGQAVLVAPQGVQSANANPHITMACQAGTEPVYSNALLAHGVHRGGGPTLTGVVEAR
jgi:hypothetical protein